MFIFNENQYYFLHIFYFYFVFTISFFIQINFSAFEDDDKSRLDRFYTFWCLKESYIKAIGIGLGFDLLRMSFSLCKKNTATVLLDGERHPEWSFRIVWIDAEHVVAVATNAGKNDKVCFFYLSLSYISLFLSLFLSIFILFLFYFCIFIKREGEKRKEKKELIKRTMMNDDEELLFSFSIYQ